MSEEKKHIEVNAKDIEKYHRGLLSPKQMHDLEKAALDDPFLADALEGYAMVPVHVDVDIPALQKRLEKRIRGGKIVNMTFSNLWWRAAAAIIVLGGLSFFIYQLSVTQADHAVSQVKNKEATTPVPVKTDTTQSSNTGNVVVNENLLLKDSADFKRTTVKKRIQVIDSMTSTAFSKTNAPVTDVSAPQSRPLEEKLNDTVQLMAAGKAKNEEAKLSKQKKDDEDTKGEMVGIFSKAQERKKIQDLSTNFFRGRILDENNNPLPFANVTNTRDNVGTYADVNGYFTLISPDSVLNVQVRSVGFENSFAKLQNTRKENAVVLQEDRSIPQTVLSNRAFNSNRSREANIKVEEAEPADGWRNYDTYLANNIKMSEDIKSKKVTGEVELSFEIDKNGEPVNIRIEKSLCDKCDKEAVRLIKEGPKWKRKSKKSRVTVLVPFEL